METDAGQLDAFKAASYLWNAFTVELEPDERRTLAEQFVYAAHAAGATEPENTHAPLGH